MGKILPGGRPSCPLGIDRLTGRQGCHYKDGGSEHVLLILYSTLVSSYCSRASKGSDSCLLFPHLCGLVWDCIALDQVVSARRQGSRFQGCLLRQLMHNDTSHPCMFSFQGLGFSSRSSQTTDTQKLCRQAFAVPILEHHLSHPTTIHILFLRRREGSIHHGS